MKHGIVLKTGDGLNFGQTVDIVSEMSELNQLGIDSMPQYYTVRPHGEKINYVIKKKYVQHCEDAYNYDTNPVTLNPYY